MNMRNHRAAVHEAAVLLLEAVLDGPEEGPMWEACADVVDRSRRARAIREQAEWHRRRADLLRLR